MSRSSGKRDRAIGAPAIPRQRRWRWAAGAATSCLLLIPALAEDLAPQTKLRLTVIQWMPLAGEYQRWDALGGELVVSPDGSISVPVIGSLAVAGKSTDEVASQVAGLLQSKLGLVDMPTANVEIVEYPPVYVVGAVAAPGAFPFRTGMTVLQALALAGGQERAEAAETLTERTRLAADLRAAENGRLRSKARIARLLAELAGEQTIAFPEELASASDAVAREVMRQEEAILAARGNSLARQQESLAELSDLYTAEIEALRSRVSGLDAAVASTEQELAGVQSLVEKGMATISRRSELERLLANAQFDRLTQMTAILRAQQSLSEANRNAAALQDERQTEIAQELQSEQANLEALELQHATALKLLLQLDLSAPQTMAAGTGEPQLGYTIVRQGAAEPQVLTAAENSELIPGDVLKVVVVPPRTDSAPGSAVAGVDP